MALVTGGSIPPVAPGDDWSQVFDYTGVPDQVLAVNARVSLKKHPWDVGALSNPPVKFITTGNVSGTGQITNPGSVGADGKWHIVIRADWNGSETAALIPGVTYTYFVTVTLNDGRSHTLEVGTWPMVSGSSLG